MFIKRWPEIEKLYFVPIASTFPDVLDDERKTYMYICQVLLLLDVLSAQSELFPRLDKGLVKDHKIGENLAQANWIESMAILGVERVQMVKNRDIKGALATDHALREIVEKRVQNLSFSFQVEHRKLTLLNLFS